VVEEEALEVSAFGVASEGAVGGDDAVAGDDDEDGVIVVGHADSAGGAGTTQALGFLGVADGGAVGDALQHLPGALLEVGARQLERQVKGLERACEIILELVDALLHERGYSLDGGEFQPFR